MFNKEIKSRIRMLEDIVIAQGDKLNKAISDLRTVEKATVNLITVQENICPHDKGYDYEYLNDSMMFLVGSRTCRMCKKKTNYIKDKEWSQDKKAQDIADCEAKLKELKGE